MVFHQVKEPETNSIFCLAMCGMDSVKISKESYIFIQFPKHRKQIVKPYI